MKRQTASTHSEFRNEFDLTDHARKQMGARSFSPDEISRVLNFGRGVHVRGIEVFAIGRKEVEQYREMGIDLQGLEGMQVLCGSGGVVITMYRNHDFRSLKPKTRSRKRCRTRKQAESR